VFDRVAVWLDEGAPDRGAFAQASDWATRLHLPLHVVAGRLSGRTPPADEGACLRNGTARDSEFSFGTREEAGFFRDADLSVFSAALPAATREPLLRETLSNRNAPVMVCSAQPARRTLVLDQGSGMDYLEQVIPLCRGLAIRPVVLSVARTERGAEERQELARKVCLSRGLDADFDLVAGCPLGTAVARAARARGCSHLIAERRHDASWLGWLRGETTRALLNLADRLTVVTLPAATATSRER
jgi:hypothetical protein